MLAGAAAFGVGTLTALQARANGHLATVFASSIDAALWSFGSGWVLLTLAFLHPAMRAGMRRARAANLGGRLAWWQFFGGLFGGFFVAVQTWSVPQVGVALFTIAVVGGQTVNALAVDAAGLGPAGRAPVTVGRVVAALGTFGGVGLAMSGRGAFEAGGIPVSAVLLAVVAGMGLAVQQAINGRVNRESGNVVTTTWVNFTWGSGLLIGLAAAQLARGTWSPPASWDAPWWAWTGGALGILFVAVGAVVVHHLGVLLAAMLTLAGQLTGAVVVDLFSPHARIDAAVLGGVLITLCSGVAATVAAGRARRRQGRDATAAVSADRSGSSPTA
ncbi:MAG: DMT family transporter [Mobilicoccus sp.]|nr:DMT family transporter [Mobilicoccus sp.]